jgi:hypothetical protein
VIAALNIEEEIGLRAEVRDRLSLLEQRDNGLTAASVLLDAQNPRSPLHHAFTWDDGKAASEWRLEQARGLIRKFRVVVRMADDQRVQPRGFVFVRGDTKESGKYRSIQTVAKDGDVKRRVLKQMRAEMMSFQKRYNTYLTIFAELKPVDVAVRTALAELDRVAA